MAHALVCLSDNAVSWIELIEIPENSGNFSEFSASYITELNRTEPNTTQPKETGKKPTSERSDFSQSGSVSVESDRIKLYDCLIELFKITKDVDKTAMRKICDQTTQKCKAGDEYAFITIFDMAKDSIKGKNPIALFVSKIKKEMK